MLARFEGDCLRRFQISIKRIFDQISPQLTPILVYNAIIRDYACSTHDRWGFFPLMEVIHLLLFQILGGVVYSLTTEGYVEAMFYYNVPML